MANFRKEPFLCRLGSRTNAYLRSVRYELAALSLVRPGESIGSRVVVPVGELRLVYSVVEAAELLGIGRSTAYELAARGELATTRLGNRVVVSRPTLTELLGVQPPLPGELERARLTLARSRLNKP